jgi:hypothetical protein
MYRRQYTSARPATGPPELLDYDRRYRRRPLALPKKVAVRSYALFL